MGLNEKLGHNPTRGAKGHAYSTGGMQTENLTAGSHQVKMTQVTCTSIIGEYDPQPLRTLSTDSLTPFVCLRVIPTGLVGAPTESAVKRGIDGR